MNHPDLRSAVDTAISEVFFRHIASIMLKADGSVVECDENSRNFLVSRELISKDGRRLLFQNGSQEDADRFRMALKEVHLTGRTVSLLYPANQDEAQRCALILRPLAFTTQTTLTERFILVLIAPLDRRRMATAKQLMELFSLTPAEARLVRALCQGDSLEEYAGDHGLKLPTVKSQLRAAFQKTRTDRQADLIRLIAGVPVIRDER